MEIALLIFAFILLATGILGAFIPVIPGPPLSYIGLLLMQWSGYVGFSSVFLWVWAGITIAITIADYFLPSLLAKRFGGSRAAIVGSFLGLLAGIFIFPPWGIIAGPFLGTFVGELIYSRANEKALKVAFGALLAFVVGSGAKLIAASLMLFFAIRALL